MPNPLYILPNGDAIDPDDVVSIRWAPGTEYPSGIWVAASVYVESGRWKQNRRIDRIDVGCSFAANGQAQQMRDQLIREINERRAAGTAPVET